MDISIIGCYVIGAIFAFFGTSSFLNAMRDKRVCIHEATARIVGYEVKRDSGDRNHMAHDHYFPICSFTAEDKEIRKVGNVGYGSRKYAIGTEMTVLYERGNPENFIIPTTGTTSWSVPLIAALIGFGLIVVTILRQIGIITV